MADFLAATNITKRFGATLALDDVTVSFARGEVHALMGENGAGKSTLGKVIAGLHAQDAGRVVIDGRELNAGDLGDAFDAGVRLVHQELAQCPNLSVAENLCLHDTPSRMGVVDCGAMRSRAARLVHTLDPSIDVDAPLGLLSPGRRQICQIAAALDDGSAGGRSCGKPRVIVFDEPTSSLSVSEADRLIEIVRRLAAEGITILYVSHRMAEVFAVSDRVTVLRDGRYVATTRTKDLDEPSLVEQMIGRKLATPVRGAFAGGEPGAALNTAIHGRERLTVSGLSSPGKLEGINLRVRAGEIVGVGGLVGSGRSELLDAIFGLAVIEALACGVPAFGTPVGIHPVALAGIAGAYCAPWDRSAWRAALRPALEADDPRVDGRDRAAIFSADRMAARVVEAWRDVAG